MRLVIVEQVRYRKKLYREWEYAKEFDTMEEVKKQLEFWRQDPDFNKGTSYLIYELKETIPACV